eukprot:g52581.t1
MTPPHGQFQHFQTDRVRKRRLVAQDLIFLVCGCHPRPKRDQGQEGKDVPIPKAAKKSTHDIFLGRNN